MLGADFVKIIDFWAREGSNFHQKIWLESFEIRDSSRLIRRGDAIARVALSWLFERNA